MALAIDEQVQHGGGHHDQGHPLVEAQATAGVGGVDAQAFDPEATGEVPRHVDRQQPAGAQRHPLADHDQQRAQRQVPECFVQERRVEGGARRVTRGQVLIVDLQPPRQRGGATEQLLVPPVAEAADGLRQRDRRCGRREHTTHRQATTTDGPDADEHPGEQATGNAQAAFPDLQPAAGLLPRLALVGDDVVQARAHHTGADRPQCDRAHVVAGAHAGGLHATTGQPHRSHDTERDHQAVGVDGQRADVQHSVGGAGNGGDQRHRGGDHGARR